MKALTAAVALLLLAGCMPPPHEMSREDRWTLAGLLVEQEDAQAAYEASLSDGQLIAYRLAQMNDTMRTNMILHLPGAPRP